MKKREGDAWMPADEFGRNLPEGIGVNVLVRDMPRAIAFQRDVLGAEIIYSDADFAGDPWMGRDLDAAYRIIRTTTIRLTGVIEGVEARGAGVEIRVYGCDPDAAEERARSSGADAVVLAGAMDKPHGLRECVLIDPDGYVWVPSVPLPADA